MIFSHSLAAIWNKIYSRTQNEHNPMQSNTHRKEFFSVGIFHFSLCGVDICTSLFLCRRKAKKNPQLNRGKGCLRYSRLV